jgi:hypothetical protein
MSALNIKFSGNPRCTKCKYYVNKRCRLFLDMDKKTVEYLPVERARLDVTLCGPIGLYWASPADPDPDRISNLDISDSFWTQE